MIRIKYKEIADLEINRGKSAISRKPEKSELKKLFIKGSWSVRDIASIIGCSKDMVFRALKEYGIEARSNKRRSQGYIFLGFIPYSRTINLLCKPNELMCAREHLFQG